jgi:hypothetical protein
MRSFDGLASRAFLNVCPVQRDLIRGAYQALEILHRLHKIKA